MALLALDIASGVMVLIMASVILYFGLRKFIRRGDIMKATSGKLKGKSVKEKYLSGNLHTISHFDFQTLKKATKNFNRDNLLGRGGFGPVYLGKLEDGRSIAVKQLSLEKSQQGESEFLSEVKMITSVQHKNLVRLLGCCSEGAQRLLVYEYMKNKSLELIVYGKSDVFLDWNTRFQIIMGVARGLQYLHEDSHLRIIHRDIKASNILLDDKFLPRISDFGLARFFPEDQAYLSTRFAGTLGYTAPEYAIRGELSEKADIYSFGVLALEIISGRKNTDLELPSEMQYLPEYAWKLRERTKLIELVDPKLRETGVAEGDVMQVLNVAFLCLQPHASLRPPMSEVVAMLICKVENLGPPMKPAFLAKKQRNNEKNSGETVVSVEPLSSPESNDSVCLSRPEALPSPQSAVSKDSISQPEFLAKKQRNNDKNSGETVVSIEPLSPPESNDSVSLPKPEALPSPQCTVSKDSISILMPESK